MPMRRLGLMMLALPLASPLAAWADWSADGYVQGSGSASSSPRNWRAGGVGTQGNGDGLGVESRLGLTLEYGQLRARISLLAHSETARQKAPLAGLLEAFVDYGVLSEDGYRVRAGLSFAGTSRENIESFWQTPYTLSLSALNTWIGEEYRPIGVEATRRLTLDSGAALDLGATAFIGNDTGPAALAWRGFALHNRPSVYGEALPVLPLASLRNPRQFGDQRSDGTQPFGPDLDGRIGYALRLRYAVPEGPQWSLFATDNRGDRALHDGDEYAWHNRFVVAGFQWPLSSEFTLIGESLLGDTAMGFPPGANVQADYHAHYLLLSYRHAAWTISGRAELFRVEERDFSVAENNDQDGHAFTLAVLYEFDDWRFGVELQHAQITRPGNRTDLLPAFDSQQGGNRVELLARRYFGS